VSKAETKAKIQHEVYDRSATQKINLLTQAATRKQPHTNEL